MTELLSNLCLYRGINKTKRSIVARSISTFAKTFMLDRVYKIKNLETGLYRCKGKWGIQGKVWSRKSDVSNITKRMIRNPNYFGIKNINDIRIEIYPVLASISVNAKFGAVNETIFILP